MPRFMGLMFFEFRGDHNLLINNRKIIGANFGYKILIYWRLFIGNIQLYKELIEYYVSTNPPPDEVSIILAYRR